MVASDFIAQDIYRSYKIRIAAPTQRHEVSSPHSITSYQPFFLPGSSGFVAVSHVNDCLRENIPHSTSGDSQPSPSPTSARLWRPAPASASSSRRRPAPFAAGQRDRQCPSLPLLQPAADLS